MRERHCHCPQKQRACGQREGAQRSLSASLSAQSGEKANMDKEKSTGLNRFVIVCKAYVTKTT
jgi:hypothetical protein